MMFLSTVAAAFLCALSNAAPQASRFTYYNMPTSMSGPCDLTTGPDGAIWIQDILVNKIARIDPKSGSIEEFDIPYTQEPQNLNIAGTFGLTAFACAIQPGDDGNLYAATGLRNQFLRINPTTKAIKVFTPQPPDPLGNVLFLNDLYRAPNGMYFSQTTANKITFFDYKTEEFTEHTPPTLNSGPVGIYYASDGGLWFCEFFANKIGRLDPKTGDITEYPVPLSLLGPAVMRAETEGRYLWFTAFDANAIGRIDIETGEFKTYTNPSLLSFPTEDTVDGEGNIWFSTATQATLNRLTPSTGKFETIEQPGVVVVDPISLPPKVDIAMHYYQPGNSIWFTEVATNQVGSYQLY